MTDREKLVELLQDGHNPVWGWFPNNVTMLQIADYLLANGVTFAENATVGSYENEEDGCPYCDATKANEYVTERNRRVEEPETNKWTFFGKRLKFCPMCGRRLSELPKEDE